MIRRAALAAALIACCAAACGGTSAKEKTMSTRPQPTASRAPPKPVAPVVIAGVRYSPVAGTIDRDGQFGGMLGAFDASNHELWRLRVYENVRVPGLEGDVQDIYFKAMHAEGTKLVIENEIGARYEVDTVARKVVGHTPPPPRSKIDPISGEERGSPPPEDW